MQAKGYVVLQEEHPLRQRMQVETLYFAYPRKQLKSSQVPAPPTSQKLQLLAQGWQTP
jgi:hypothetical protein